MAAGRGRVRARRRAQTRATRKIMLAGSPELRGGAHRRARRPAGRQRRSRARDHRAIRYDHPDRAGLARRRRRPNGILIITRTAVNARRRRGDPHRRRSRSRSCATSSKASPTRCSRRSCCSAFSPIVKEGDRLLGEPVHGRRRDARAGVPPSRPPRDADPRAAGRDRQVSGRDDARRRRLHAERSVSAAARTCPTSAVHARYSAAGGCIALQRRHRPSQDVGGMSPGSHPDERDRDLPGRPAHSAAQVLEAGTINRRCMDILRHNIRLPDAFAGDLNAQLAACKVGARRLGELAATTAPTCWSAASRSCSIARRR